MMGMCVTRAKLLVLALCLAAISVHGLQTNESVVLDPTCASQVANSLTNRTGFLTEEVAGAALIAFAQLCINVPATCALPGNSTGDLKTFSPSSPGKHTETILLSVLLPAGLLLSAICSWVLWHKWHTPGRNKRRTLWGKLKPPAASEESTLVVSDIESSTHLWEVLDEHVMDTAITQHHACLRACIAASAGYEASVEGDSFITAFHDANDASQYCISVQAALLLVKWPEALLAVPNCRPIYVSDIPPPGYSKQSAQQPFLLLGAPAGNDDTCTIDTMHDVMIKAADHRDTSAHASKSSGGGSGARDGSQYGPSSQQAVGLSRLSRQGQLSMDGAASKDDRSLTSRAGSGACQNDNTAGSGSRAEPAETASTVGAAPGMQQGQGPVNMGPWLLSRSGGQKSPLAKGSNSTSSSAPDNTVRNSGDAGMYRASHSNDFANPAHGSASLSNGHNMSGSELVQQPHASAAQRASPDGSDKSTSSCLKPAISKQAGPRKMNSSLQWADQQAQQGTPQWRGSFSPESLTNSTPTSWEETPRISPVLAPHNNVLPPVPAVHLQPHMATAAVVNAAVSSTVCAQAANAQGIAGCSTDGFHKDSQSDAPVSMTDAIVSGTGCDASGECAIHAGDILVTLQQPAWGITNAHTTSADPLPLSSSPTLLLNNSASPLEPSMVPDVEAFSVQLPVMVVTHAPDEACMHETSSTAGMSSSTDAAGAAGRADWSAGKAASNRPNVSRQSSRLAEATYPTLSIPVVPMGGAVDEAGRNSSPMASPVASPTMQPAQQQANRLVEQFGPADPSSPSNNEASAGSAPFLRHVAFRMKSFSRTLASGLFKATGSSMDSLDNTIHTIHQQSRHTGSMGTAKQHSGRSSLSNQTAATSKARLHGSDASGASEDTNEATTTVGQMLQSRYYDVSAADVGARLLFRGLRVRMGCHSGLTDQDCHYNKAASRMQYTGGPACLIAKAVCDSACGGMILLSDDCHNQLYLEELQESAMVLHMGDHQLKNDIPIMALHQVAPRQLIPRLPLLAPVRSHCTCGLGVLDAPAGLITVAFMHVVGEASLMAWNPAVALHSMSLFQQRAGTLLHKHGGYLVEGVNGFILASFPRAISAMRWALQCVTDLKRADWPEELLAHELGEELVTRTLDATGRLTENIMLRGLRIKAGLDCGKLRGEVSCVTGRMAYRGRYMNRAARIASAAGTGQVLVSADVYNACKTSAASHLYAASSLGNHRFKGVVEPVEVFDIRPQSSVMLTKRTSVSLTQAAHQDLALQEALHAMHSMFSVSAHSRRASRPSNLGPFANPAFAPSRPTSGASYISRGPSRTMSFRNSVSNSVRRSLLMLGLGASTGGMDRSRTHTSHTHTTRSSAASSRNIVLGETPQPSGSTVMMTGGSSNNQFLNVATYKPMMMATAGVRRASTTMLGAQPPTLNTRMSMDMPGSYHSTEGGAYARHAHAKPYGVMGLAEGQLQAEVFPDGQVHGGQTLLLTPTQVLGAPTKAGNGAQMPVVKEDSDSGPLNNLVLLRVPPQASLDRRTMSDTGTFFTHLNGVTPTIHGLPAGHATSPQGMSPTATAYNGQSSAAAALSTTTAAVSPMSMDATGVPIIAAAAAAAAAAAGSHQQPCMWPEQQQQTGFSRNPLMHAMHAYDARMGDRQTAIQQQHMEHNIMSSPPLALAPVLGPRSSVNVGSAANNVSSSATNNTGSSVLNPRGSMAAYCTPMEALPEDATSSNYGSSNRRGSRVTWGEDALAPVMPASYDAARSTASAAVGPQGWDIHVTAGSGTRGSAKRASAPQPPEKPQHTSANIPGNLFVVSGASSDEDEEVGKEGLGACDSVLSGDSTDKRSLSYRNSSSSSGFAVKAKRVLRQASLRNMAALLQRMAGGGGSGGQENPLRKEHSHQTKQWHANALAADERAGAAVAAVGNSAEDMDAGADAKAANARLRVVSATGTPPLPSALRTRFSNPHIPATAAMQQAYQSNPVTQVSAAPDLHLPAALAPAASHLRTEDSTQQLSLRLYQQQSQPVRGAVQDVEMGAVGEHHNQKEDC